MKNKLIILSLSLFLMGCSSRKVNKLEVKEKTEVVTVDSTKTEKTETEKTVLIDSSTIDEIEITPIDSTKEMVVNGKRYFNSRIKVKKTKNNISVVNEKKVAQIEQKAVKTNIVATKEATKKETEAKRPFSFWWIIIIVGVCYIIYRKYLR